MSGECNLLHEIFRGKLNRLSGGQKDCVQRRATKSLQMNPNCKAIADKAVSDAFATCYADQCPLDDKKVQMNPNGKAIADKAVSDAFATCYADQCPLDDKKV
jgi:hypothetical protein